MQRVSSILSRIFGLFWLIFGANGLFHFFPIPAPPETSAYFMQALEQAGYVLPLLYGAQVTAGVMLLLGVFAPLALAMLVPITLNILLYDLALNPAGLTIGIGIAAWHTLLLWKYRETYRPLFSCPCSEAYADTLRRR